MTEPPANGKALIEQIAKALVDAPAQVFVDEYEDDDEQVIELEVAEAISAKSLDVPAASHAPCAACWLRPDRSWTSATRWRSSNSGTAMSGEFITLARVVKTQGRRGEVGVELHTDVPDRFRRACSCGRSNKDGGTPRSSSRRRLAAQESDWF